MIEHHVLQPEVMPGSSQNYAVVYRSERESLITDLTHSPLTDEHVSAAETLGVGKISTLAPCLYIVHDSNEPHQLWLGTHDERVRFQHILLRTSLQMFERSTGSDAEIEPQKQLIYVYLVGNEQGRWFLALEKEPTRRLEALLQDEAGQQQLHSLMERYEIEQLIGKPLTDQRYTWLTPRGDIGAIREEEEYRQWARKYEMTTSEYLRFRRRVISAFVANQPIRWDDIVREIVQDRDAENRMVA